jgi:hypothetical protein
MNNKKEAFLKSRRDAIIIEMNKYDFSKPLRGEISPLRAMSLS